MGDAAQTLIDQVLKLAPEERRRVLGALLENEPGGNPDEVEAAWVVEAERRLDGDRSRDRVWSEVRAEVSAKYGLK